MVIHMDWLAEDLLLLTIDAYRGRLGQAYALSYALMGAELIRLAAQGQIDLSGDRIVLTNAAPTGDAELDAALAGIGESASPAAASDSADPARADSSAATLAAIDAATRAAVSAAAQAVAQATAAAANPGYGG
jgi:golgi phosphoprotein 3